MVRCIGRQHHGQPASGDASGASGSATLRCSGGIVEDAETICGLSVCSASFPILLPKLTSVSHSPHYLGRGGTLSCERLLRRLQTFICEHCEREFLVLANVPMTEQENATKNEIQ
jgi:hypothetical protein